MLLIDRQVSSLCKDFANKLLVHVKLSKTQLSKIIQPGRFLARFLGPLMEAGLPLMKNLLTSLAKSVLIPLKLAAAAAAAAATADAEIHKKILGSGTYGTFVSGAATLIISNEEMKYIIKLSKYLEDSGVLIKDVNQTMENEAKEPRRRFFGMLLGRLGAGL